MKKIIELIESLEHLSTSHLAVQLSILPTASRPYEQPTNKPATEKPTSQPARLN